MNIIIEGPDGVGKSTLVTKLKEHYNIDSIRLSYKDPKDINFYGRILEKTDCIFDRQFLSEIVYAPIFGRECQLSWDDVYKLHEKTKELGIKIFILDADTDEILNRINKRGDEFEEVKNNINNLRLRFLYLAEVLDIEIIDTSKIEFEDIIRKVEKYREEYRNNKFK